MPYKPKHRRRKSKKTTGSLARVITRQIKTHERKRLEHKYWQTSMEPTGISNSGTIYDLSDMPQGTTDISRVGDRVHVTSLSLRLNVILADTTNLVRVLVFQWRQNSVSISPAFNKLLYSKDGASYDYKGFYRHDSLGVNFIPLYDRVLNLTNSGANQQINLVKRINLRFANRKISYDAGAVEGSNKFYLALVSDSGVVSHPAVTYEAYLSYTDS